MEREKLQNSILVLALVFGLSSFAAAVYYHRDRESLSQQLRELSEQGSEVVITPAIQKIERPAPSGNDSEDIAQLNAYIERLEQQQAN